MTCFISNQALEQRAARGRAGGAQSPQARTVGRRTTALAVVLLVLARRTPSTETAVPQRAFEAPPGLTATASRLI